MHDPEKMGCLLDWIVRKIQWSVGLKKNLSSVTDGASQEDRVHSSSSYKQIYKLGYAGTTKRKRAELANVI